MRIAIFTDTFYPDINGVATSTSILKKQLELHGHDVLIVTTTLPQNVTVEDEKNIVRIKSIALKKIYGYRLAPLFSLGSMLKVKNFHSDIIHIQTEFGIGICGKIIGQILKIPVVYTYHTMWSDYTHYISKGHQSLDSFMKIIIKKISKIYGNTCSALIVPSQKTAKILKSYGIHNSLYVIPTGIELDKFSQINEKKLSDLKCKYHLENKIVFLYLGRIAKEKSIDILIDAFDKAKIKDSVFLIVGDGPDRQELENYARKQNSEILFLGSKESSDVPYYYHLCDYFMSASITETQGLTYLEAMASKKVILARYDKNLEDVIVDGHNGYFFHSQEDLILLLKSLSQSHYDKLCENAYQTSLRFNSSIFYDNIIKVYKEAINTYENVHHRKNTNI